MLADRALKEGVGPVRIVVPTEAEAQLLADLLQAVVDDYGVASAAGRVDVITASEEALLIAEGRLSRTILLCSRPPQTQHLNLYPSEAVEQIAYPCEAAYISAALERQHFDAMALQGEHRQSLLKTLSLEIVATVGKDQTPRSATASKRVDGKPVQISRSSDFSTDLDFDALIDGPEDSEGLWTTGAEAVSLSGTYVKVTFDNGLSERYPTEHSMDVWYPESEETHRIPVSNLVSGMRVIRFVDGRYDSLFERTNESIKARLPTRERYDLKLWEKVKKGLMGRYKNRKQLHADLESKGLAVTYETFASWFRGDDAKAPQRFEEFAFVANCSGAFLDEKHSQEVFASIQRSRGRRRTIGRKLHAVLRALWCKQGFEEALDQLRKVSPDLADVSAAVDVSTVFSVHPL
jgi:hypothetical protein